MTVSATQKGGFHSALPKWGYNAKQTGESTSSEFHLVVCVNCRWLAVNALSRSQWHNTKWQNSKEVKQPPSKKHKLFTVSREKSQITHEKINLPVKGVTDWGLFSGLRLGRCGGVIIQDSRQDLFVYFAVPSESLLPN